ncbi:MAG: cytosine/adenosine deaminase-related metal-dependent hydrolase [Kiritimatiellia bacterium]|jgi:cytosine/adenosine deaminase-related metal-dependent hydrolase
MPRLAPVRDLMVRLRCRCLLPDGQIAERTIVLDGERIVQVRPWSSDDPECVEGIVVPGLVNAHTHLELSWMDLLPGGDGFVAWGRGLFEARATAPSEGQQASIAAQAARSLVELGVAAVSDICSEASTVAALSDAGLSGIVHRELLGFAPQVRDWQIERAPSLVDTYVGDDVIVYQRPSPHAPYSTPSDLVSACLSASDAPASIHLAEDAHEDEFLVHGTGEFAVFLDGLNVDWRWWSAPGLRSVPWLASLNGLGPETLVVHAVYTHVDDWALLASTQTPVCLCIRSNLQIGGVAPPIAGLVEAGVPLCLGTDSLASSPSLDVLDEIPALVRAAPEIPAVRWLIAATRGGADALGMRHLGQIREGTCPGLLQLFIDDPQELAVAAPARRWIVRPAYRLEAL